nr:uncharacterized protein LOC111512939 [Leptinotarsa decemlineata]
MRTSKGSLFLRLAMSSLWLYFLLCLVYGESARILGFFSYPSVSHQSIFRALWRELSLRGHEVTVITPNPWNDPSLINLTEIDVGFTFDIVAEKNFAGNMGKGKSALSRVIYVHDIAMELTEAEILHENVLKLLTYDEYHFDVILVQSLHPLMYFFGAKFRAPVVAALMKKHNTETKMTRHKLGIIRHEMVQRILKNHQLR